MNYFATTTGPGFNPGTGVSSSFQMNSKAASVMSTGDNTVYTYSGSLFVIA